MKTNEQKANEIAVAIMKEGHIDKNGMCQRRDLERAAMQMAEAKDLEYKNQEQSLLWTLYSILDDLAVEGEAREKAINEFKEHLKYYQGD